MPRLLTDLRVTSAVEPSERVPTGAMERQDHRLLRDEGRRRNTRAVGGRRPEHG